MNKCIYSKKHINETDLLQYILNKQWHKRVNVILSGVKTVKIVMPDCSSTFRDCDGKW